MNRQNGPWDPSLEEGVVLRRDRIYLMGHDVCMVGGKEKRMMTRMVVECDLDLPVMEEGNEVGVAAVVAAEQKIGRLTSELVNYHNHRHLCYSGHSKVLEQPHRQALGGNFLRRTVAVVRELGHP